MKIAYVTTARIPTEKAHGLQIVKMCEAFAAEGSEVELVVPQRNNAITTDPFEYYGVRSNFRIMYLPTPDLVSWGSVGFWIHRLFFALRVRSHLRNAKADLVYGRDEFVLALCGTKAPIVYEAHQGRWDYFVQRAVSVSKKIVVISHGLAGFFKAHGVPAEKILLAPDAVDLGEFKPKEKQEARKQLGIAAEQFVVTYTGHLYDWKGADLLADAAKHVPEILFVLVGGTVEDISRFKNAYGTIPNIRIEGAKPHSQMPLYLAAADALALPNSGMRDISRLYTSPMKLFEYMAAERPIIAADLPSLHEILSDEDAFFFRPDDAEALASAIRTIKANEGAALEKAKSAFKKVKRYTWIERAKNILAAAR